MNDCLFLELDCTDVELRFADEEIKIMISHHGTMGDTKKTVDKKVKEIFKDYSPPDDFGLGYFRKASRWHYESGTPDYIYVFEAIIEVVEVKDLPFWNYVLFDLRSIIF